MKRQSNRVALTATAALLSVAVTAHGQYTVTGVGRYDFNDTSGSGARELSGITHAGGSTYLSVGDKDKLLHTVTINLNTATGSINSASIDASPVTLSSSFNGDREAIAIQSSYILTANEDGPQLEAFVTATGASTGTAVNISTPGLGVYGFDRPNRAWESLAVYPSDPGIALFANEDALTVDGPAAGFTNGAMVRVQAALADAANSTATAIGQFAYPIDAINGDNPFVSGETSGLVELLVLPDNTVIAMERAVGLTGYRIRLYEVNGDLATDVSGFSGLDGLTPGVDYKPLTKTLLWEITFGVTTNSNFEGLALGPVLDDGEQSLIIIADNASGPVLPVFGQQWTAQDQSLYSLVLDQLPNPACVGDEGCLTADLSEDGFVGIADLNIILSRWNETVLPGSASDPTVDGFVGIGDLNVVLGNWNAGTPPNAGALIPEPATLTLTLFGLSTLLRTR